MKIKIMMLIAYLFAVISADTLLSSETPQFTNNNSNSKYNSNSSQLKNVLYIRLKSENKESTLLSNISNSGYKIERRLLQIDKAAKYSTKVYNELVKRKINVSKAELAESKLLRTFVISYEGDTPPAEKAIAILKEFNDIEIAEPIIVSELCGNYVPNDSLVDSQKMFETMQAFQAWDIYKGDTNVVIGISDSGVLQAHKDLAPNIWINKAEIPNDGLDNDGNGYIDDYNGVNFVSHIDGSSPASTFNSKEGHGTGTAGIASAVCNNKIGIAGVGFNTKFFPMKTMPDNNGGIMFGYESIIYAANMGFQVVNCSWGSMSYSDINKSIIDYAVSRGVSIVASAGNHGTTEPFYPSAYPGVLGVGVTNPNDLVIPMSAYGAGVDIMAPGQETRTTSNDSTYGTFCCTSGAAPIVAAQVALIRGLHPELDNLQANEFARICSESIEAKNDNKYRKLLPNRLNLLKSLQNDPFASPAINFVEYRFQAKGEPENTRFSLDDTIKFQIIFKNYLGPADSVTCYFSIVGDSLNSLKAIDTVLGGKNIKSNEEFYLGDFSFSIETYNPETPFLRVDIVAAGYKDYFLIPFTPYKAYTTFSNEAILLTACDNGRLGYNDPPNDNQGRGFQQINKGSMLYEAGFIATANDNKVVTQVRKDKNVRKSDFAAMKPYLAPHENIAIFNDGFAPDSMRLGIEVESMIEVPEGKKSVAQVYLKIKNVGVDVLKDLSTAYFFDFDIGGSGLENGAFPFNDLLPATMRDGKSLSAIFVRDGNYPKIGLAVSSNFPNVIPQFASFSADSTAKGFALYNQYKYLNSGAKYFNEVPDDITCVIGMKFPGEIAVGDSVTYVLTMAIADSVLQLRNAMWNILDPTVSTVKDNNVSSEIIYPNPANDKIFIEIDGVEAIDVFDMKGEQKKNIIWHNINNSTNVLNVVGLSTGAYMLKIRTHNGTINKIFIKN